MIPILWLFYDSYDYSNASMTPILWLVYNSYSMTMTIFFDYPILFLSNDRSVYTDSYEYWYFLCDCFLKLLHMHVYPYFFISLNQ